MGLFWINNRFIYYNPTVKEHYLFLRAIETKDHILANYILYSLGITFQDEDEINQFYEIVYGENSRFDSATSNGEIVFDWFIDSDLIYCDFVKNYPNKVLSIEDLENMSFWEFNILFAGLNTTLSDRIEVRATKPTKDMSASQSRSILSAKKSVKILDAYKFN